MVHFVVCRKKKHVDSVLQSKSIKKFFDFFRSYFYYYILRMNAFSNLDLIYNYWNSSIKIFFGQNLEKPKKRKQSFYLSKLQRIDRYLLLSMNPLLPIQSVH